MTPQPTLVCLGDCCIDAYLPPIGRGFAGGSALNVAVAVRRAGARCACVGWVGSDRAGEAVLQLLAREGVDTSHLVRQPGPTRRVPVRVTAEGHQFVHELMAPRRAFVPSGEMLEFARSSSMVHLNWLDEPLQAVRALAQPDGSRLALDYGPNSPERLLDATLPAVEVAFFALRADRADDAESLAISAGARGARVVVVTLGEAGSLGWDGSRFIHQAAVPLADNCRGDSLGAGDGFTGAFLAAYLDGQSLENCLAAGATHAAGICVDYGSWPGAEIDATTLQSEETDW